MCNIKRGCLVGVGIMVSFCIFAYYESANMYNFLQQGVNVLTSPNGKLIDRENITITAYQSNNTTDTTFFSMSVTEDDIEQFSAGLPETIKNYKNPCWLETVSDNFSYYFSNLYYEYHKAHPEFNQYIAWDDKYAKMQKILDERKKNASGKPLWRMRCFPYFFLIGFTKCGTSDLHFTLSMLPEYFRGVMKEPEFWNLIRFEFNFRTGVQLPTPTLSSYLDLFDLAAEKIDRYVINAEDGSLYHPGITGDLDPQTIWRIPHWHQIKGNENKMEPVYLPAHHLHRLSPKTKFLILLRNPVERTFSHYKFFVSIDGTYHPGKFHHEVEEVLHKMNFCFMASSARSCVYQALSNSNVRSVTTLRSVLASIYHVFIKDWMNVFPREQFLFIKSEEYFKNRTAVTLEIIKFLEMDTAIPREFLRNIDEHSVINKSIQSEMWNKTRVLLQSFFNPINKQLSVLLRDEKWVWDYYSGFRFTNIQ